MTEGTISARKAISIVAVTWILSLLTTLAIVHLITPAPIGTNQIADSAITYLKLASLGIPHNATTSTEEVSTTSTNFVDIPDMSVDLTLSRKSMLIIMFSMEAQNTGGNYLYARAMINATTQARPASSAIVITNSSVTASHSFTFYMDNVSPGKYTIKIQWRVFSFLAAAYAQDRSLIVFALPA
ncbi:MAG: hypothetical protein QXJ11_06790 [Candidatus Bathyarchaeia archaeon]